MREKICCILDRSENYAVRLTEYINEGHILPYRTLAFTSVQAVREASKAYDIEIFLFDEAFAAEETDDVDAAVSVILTESDTPEENQVCRYQSADGVIKDVLGKIDFYGSVRAAASGAKVISVYSPATKCFKTTAALAIAIGCGRMGRALFISLEQFAGLDNILREDRGGLSEAIYYFHLGGESACGKILSCTGSTGMFDYLAPVTCADDVADLTCEDIVKLISMLADKGSYQYIITDVGCVFNRPWKLFEISERIVVPEPLDYMGKRKAAQFERYLIMSGRKGIEDKIYSIRFPYNESAAGYEISLENAGSAPVQDIVRRCIHG